MPGMQGQDPSPPISNSPSLGLKTKEFNLTRKQILPGQSLEPINQSKEYSKFIPKPKPNPLTQLS